MGRSSAEGRSRAPRTIHIEVWSAGLERWEPAILDEGEALALDGWHSKIVGAEVYDLCHDPLGRWFRAQEGRLVAFRIGMG